MNTHHIFVVDDDDATRILVEAQLKPLGKVLLFSRADDAKAAIESSGFPDLIITDVDMPGLGGMEFLRWIRSRNASVPVIVVSAVHTDDNLFDAIRMGATDFICKPFPLRNVQDAARSALRDRPLSGKIELESDGEWVAFRFSSDFEHLRRVNNLVSTLVEKKFSKEVCHRIKLAIEEIGTNAIEWGNRSNPGLKVVVRYRIRPENIDLVIEDEGAGPTQLGRSEGTPAAPMAQSQRRDEGKREGGFGRFLVHQTMDEVTYLKDGHCVSMTYRLNKPEGAEASEGQMPA